MPEPTCQDLKKLIDDFIAAADDWILRRQIADMILVAIGLLLPGWPIIDVDDATNAELEAWINALFNGQHACASVFQPQGGGN